MLHENHSTQVDPPTGVDRRAFCVSALAAAAAAAAVSCGGGGGGGSSTPAPPPPAAGPKTTTDSKAGMLALANGATRDYRNLGEFFLIKDATGIYAMTTVCTHLGCTIGLPSGTTITCPCHGSQYDLGGGNTLGPAVNPLVHFAVTEPTPGGAIVVNTAQAVAATVRLA